MARTKSPSVITASAMMAMLERQNYRCAISGRELTPESAQLDHIQPIAKGGDHSMSNLWIVETSANRAKNTMTYEDFVALCRDVVQVADQRTSSEVA